MNAPQGERPPVRAMRTVYSYLFPEVWTELQAVERAVDRSFYTLHAPAREIESALASLFTPALSMPATPAGTVDLDALHVPVLERVLNRYEPIAPGITTFGHRYPTPGSSEGIHKILTTLRTHRGVDTIYVLEGEYEGYAAYASDLGMRVRTITDLSPAPDLEPGYWCISNPSARNGNLLPEGAVTRLCDAGHRVVLDLAYAGMTPPAKIDLTHENIVAAVLSLSKPYGLFRFRIGCTVSREEIPSLYGSKWFNDPLRLLQGLRVVEAIGPGGLERYRATQTWAVHELERDTGMPIQPSDVFLLAHASGSTASNPLVRERLAPYVRGPGYRFCLTPLFEEYESRMIEKYASETRARSRNA